MVSAGQIDGWIAETRQILKSRESLDVKQAMMRFPSQESDAQRDCLMLLKILCQTRIKQKRASLDALKSIFIRYPESVIITDMLVNTHAALGMQAECLDFMCDCVVKGMAKRESLSLIIMLCWAGGYYEALHKAYVMLEPVFIGSPRYDAEFLTTKGLLLEKEGRSDEAEVCYREAMGIFEGFGFPFNFDLLCKLKKHGALMRPARKITKDTGVLVIPFLGFDGRFGDSICQYVVLKAIEKNSGLQLMLPEWFGRRLFANSDEPNVEGSFDYPINEPLDLVTRERKLPPYSFNIGVDLIRRTYDSPVFKDYLQKNANWLSGILEPCELVAGIFEKVRSALLKRGNTIVSMHARFGDFQTTCPHLLTPLKAYYDWIRTHSAQCDNPVFFLAADDLRAARDGLNTKNLVSVADLGLDVESGLEMVYDFAGLCAADILLSSHSTFCRSSTLFNKNSPNVWISPSVDRPFEPALTRFP